MNVYNLFTSYRAIDNKHLRPSPDPLSFGLRTTSPFEKIGK